MFVRSNITAHKCVFEKINNPLCEALFVSIIYRCNICEKYHICDGGQACMLVNTGETTVCLLTGVQTYENMQPAIRALTTPLTTSESCNAPTCFDHIVTSLQNDIALFFNQQSNLKDLHAIILENSQLNVTVKQLIKNTFMEFYMAFESLLCNYDIICSMYIHVIILIYSSKTVYGNLLFKCTKNKKFDFIVKRLRQSWMHMLKTGRGITTT